MGDLARESGPFSLWKCGDLGVWWIGPGKMEWGTGGWASLSSVLCCAPSLRDTRGALWRRLCIGPPLSRMRRDAQGCASSRRRLPSPLDCPNGWKPGGKTLTNPWNSPSTSGEGRAGLRLGGEADRRRESPGAPPVGPDPSRPRFFGWAPRILLLFVAANASGPSAPAFCSHA
jgi:hypothetical protein